MRPVPPDWRERVIEAAARVEQSATTQAHASMLAERAELLGDDGGTAE